MSDNFDPDKYLESNQSDFDPDAYLSEQQPIGSNLENKLSDTLTGAAVGALPAGVTYGTGATLEKAASKFGPYSSEQLETILSDYNRYKNIDPKETIESVQKAGQDFNQSINELEKQAYDALSKETKPFTYQDYRQRVIDQAKASGYAPVEKDTKGFQQLLNENELLKRNPIQSKLPEDIEVNPRNILTEDKLDLLRRAEAQTVEKMGQGIDEILPELKGYYKQGEKAASKESIQKALEVVTPGDTLTGSRVYETVRKLREIEDPFVEQLARSLRAEDVTGPASDLFKKENEKISELSNLEKKGYISRGIGSKKRSDDKYVTLEEKNIKKIINDVKSATGKDKKISSSAAKNLEELYKILPEDLAKDLNLAVLKGVELDPKNALKLSMLTKGLGYSTFINPMSLIATGISAGYDATKSAKGSIQAARLGKGLKAAAKPLAAALPLLGAGIAGAQAAEKVSAGELSPAEGTALTAAEFVNPLPVDLVEGYAAGKKTLKETDSLPKAAGAAFQAGAVEPIKQAGEAISDLGTQKSESARNLMQERQQRIDELLKRQEESKKSNNLNKNPKSASLPVDRYEKLLAEVQQSRNPSVQSIQPILEQAASGDENAKARAEFLIQQDPALRNKLT